MDYEGLLRRIVHYHEGARRKEARQLYRRVLRAGNPRAQRYFGRVAIDYHEPELAVKLLTEALRGGAAAPEVHNDLGIAQWGCDRRSAAEASFRDAIARAPGNAMFFRNLASLLKEAGELAEAGAMASRAIDLEPEHVVGHAELGDILLRRGEPRAALESVRRARSAAEASKASATWPLALEALALAQLGDAGGHDRLVDYASLVQCIAPAVEGECLPARLRKRVTRHRSLTWAPRRFATRAGWHTLGNLLADPAPVFRALEGRIRDALAEYAQRLGDAPLPPDHPFLRQRSASYRLEAWAVKLGARGYQKAHVHPDGWLSGVYYVSVDEVVRADDPEHEGWLELGCVPEPYRGTGAAPATQLIRPRTGSFVLFPSYVWHRTIPFHSGRERISLAFDVIPAAEAVPALGDPRASD